MANRYFSHYWLEETCRWEKEHYAGQPFKHTASNLLRKRGVKPGDFIYGWSFNDGKLYIIGRMQVGRFVTQREADALYKSAEDWAWEATDHVFAKPGTATPMTFNKVVPPNLVRKLSFLDPTGEVKSPKFIANGKADPQTFRAVRELTPETAVLLDRLLDGGSNHRESELKHLVEADLDSLREEESFEEGGKRTRYTNYYERDAKLRIAAIGYHGTECSVCGFNFGRVYGERGAGFIEVHHLRPVSDLKKKTAIDPKKDMTVLCSNCHRMVHRRKDDVLSIEDLKNSIRSTA